MNRVISAGSLFTVNAIKFSVKIVSADATKASVAALASLFFANAAVHSTAQFFDWPFGDSCSALQIPGYMLQTAGYAACALITGKTALAKLEHLLTYKAS